MSRFTAPLKVKLADGTTTVIMDKDGSRAPSHTIKFAANRTTVGGAAAEAITVTGALITDIPFVTLQNDGTGNVTIASVALTANTLTITFSANPGNDAIVSYQILRAAV